MLVVMTMTPEMAEALKEYPSVLRYLQSIPEHLWDLFLPARASELPRFARSIHELRARETEREYILGLQKKYGLPLRPNASMDETMKLVRIARKKRSASRSGRLPFDPDDNLPIDPDEQLM